MAAFSELHPIVTAIYFVSVIGVATFVQSPALAGVALLSGLAFCVLLGRGKRIRFFRDIGFYILLFIVVALSNPLFSHRGITVLFFMNGNPITAEAALYGINLAATLLAVITWFRCVNGVMTEDKLLYLIGGVAPKLALLLSATLRFVPMLKEQGAKMLDARRTMGLSEADSLVDKVRGTAKVFSALITRALEAAIDSGASMKARGYGLKGRSRYSLYRFRVQDGAAAATVLLCDAVVVVAAALGRFRFEFYPAVSFVEFDGTFIVGVAAYAVICALPFVLEVREALLWKYYVSRI